MYNINNLSENENNEEIYAIESIFLKPNSVSESIKEAILEMNIMREKTIPNKVLNDFIKKYEE